MSEPTRIISPSGADAENRFPKPAPLTVRGRGQELPIYRADLTPGAEKVNGIDSEVGQRFASEIHFVNYYARKLADTLAMQRLDMAIVEDRDSQTSFFRNGSEVKWQGIVAAHRLPIHEVRTAISQH